MPSLIFRKGLDLKHAVAGMLADNYHSAIVEQVKADDFTHRAGRLTVHLAREFGFCYGVDRAVDYAYQTRERFPDRNVFLTGEIIHNPHVNDKLRAMGIRFLTDAGEDADRLTAADVVILPAFGVTVAMLEQFDRRGCTMIDTTCGSVLNVWKNVRRYAEGGYTSIIHGKVWHEETQATASQAVQYGGKYLVVFDRPETEIVCDYIRRGGDRDAFLERFEKAASPGFDPDRDLQRIGLANQTTMLMTESLEIGEMIRAAMRDRYDDAGAAGALSGVRHDLQRHPGSPGRGRGAAARQAGRPDDRDRRLQQQQHREPRPDVPGVAADVPHRRSRLPGVGAGDPAPPGGREGRGDDRRLAPAGRAGVDRPDVGRLDPRQPGRRRHRQAHRILRLAAVPVVKSCLPLNSYGYPVVIPQVTAFSEVYA